MRQTEENKLQAIIDAYCKKHQTSWLHRDDIEPLLKEYLKTITPEDIRIEEEKK